MILPTNIISFISFVDISVISSILKHKSIENAVIFHCFNVQYINFVQKTFMENNIRITNIHLTNYTGKYWFSGYTRLGLVIDTACNTWENSFSLFDEPFQISISLILKTDNISSTTDILSHYPIEFNSDFNLISKVGNYYKIYELYNTGFYKNGNFIVNEIGYWDKKISIITKRSKLLTGVNLKLTVVYPDPINNVTFEHFLNVPKKSQIDPLHKLKFYTLMLYLRDMYKMKYNLQRTASWGYLHNGSFDGVVGALQRKESDIGGTSVFFRKDRLEIVDYAVETWGSRICFIFRHPKHPGGTNAIYTRPFASTVWYCMIGLLLFIGTFLIILLKLNILMKPGDEEDASSSLSVLFVFSALGQQGMEIQRQSSAVKITIFITFLFALTLYQYYNAMLVSTLLRETPKTIRTLAELLHSNMKIGVEDVIYNKDYFKRTTDPVAKALYHQKVLTPTKNNFYPPNKGMRLVKAGGFAFHVDTIIAYPTMRSSFSEAEICEAQEVFMIPPQKMGAILQKRSPYKEHVSYGIRKIFETGVMSRLQSVWDEPKPPCIRTPDTRAFSVNIHEFSMALIMLAIGMILAFTVLVLENIAFRVTRSRVIDFRL